MEVLKSLTLRTEDLGESVLFNSYFQFYDDEIVSGEGVLVVPSFYEKFELMPASFYDDIVLSERPEEVGLEAAEIKTSKDKSIIDEVKAFFISVYEHGVNARPYIIEQEKMVTYDPKTISFNTVQFPTPDQYGYLCKEFEQKIINV